MTINNGTKKIEAPPEKIPCTCYVGSSVGMISILIWFLFVCARDFLLLWCEILWTRLFFLSLSLGIASSWCPSLLLVYSESCFVWNIFQSLFILLLDFLCICFLCRISGEILNDICAAILEFICSEFPWNLLWFVFVCVHWERCLFFVLMGEFGFIIFNACGDLRFEVIIDFIVSLLAMYLSTYFLI